MKKPRRGITGLLGRLSFKMKILLIFILCVFLPMLIQQLTFYNGTLQSTESLLHQQMVNAAERVRSSLNSTLNDTVQLLIRFHSDSRLYEFMDAAYDTPLDYLIAYQNTILPIMKYEITFHSQLERVYFYTENPTVYDSAYVRPMAEPGDALADLQGDSTVISTGESPVITLHIGSRLYANQLIRSLSLTSSMTYYSPPGSYHKLIRMDISLSGLSGALKGSPFENMIITDAAGRILCSANTYRTDAQYDLFDPAQLSPDSQQISLPLQSLPFTLHAWYDGSLLFDEFMAATWHTLAYSMVGFMAALAAMLIIGREITGRVSGIIKKADRIARGDFADRAEDRRPARRDELAQIEEQIDALNEQLQVYIEREYAAKLHQADLERDVTQAKLLALQSQVNPHFLFNALESIRLNALDRDRAETAKMIKYMAQMFRYLVDWEGDFVHMRQELDFLHEYLVIQQYRFGSDFQHQIEIDQAAKACMVPKLILQPMVENACVHGVEPSTNQKHVSIAVTLCEGQLVMRVSDTGQGISPERLNTLKASLASDTPGSSVGLRNVYQRLELIYRQNFSFRIDSQPGRGTVCTVVIPAQYTDPGR